MHRRWCKTTRAGIGEAGHPHLTGSSEGGRCLGSRKKVLSPRHQPEVSAGSWGRQSLGLGRGQMSLRKPKGKAQAVSRAGHSREGSGSRAPRKRRSGEQLREAEAEAEWTAKAIACRHARDKAGLGPVRRCSAMSFRLESKSWRSAECSE